MIKTNKSKTNWIIDAVLFAGFVLSFFLDLTGVDLHQWLGMALGVLVAYHLVAHKSWVEAVTQRLFGRTSGQSRIYYAIDVALLLGFYLILLTGLMMSTWLALPLQNYLAWKNVHVVVSITALLLVCLKIGLHWRWIVTVAERCIFVCSSPVKNGLVGKQVAAPASAGRRDFLKLMGLVGAATVVATGSALNGLDWPSEQESDLNTGAAKEQTNDSSLAKASTMAQELPVLTLTPVSVAPDVPLLDSTPTPELLSTPTPIYSASAEPAKSCIVRCDNHCSYPGRCRRYTDANQNGLCDFGECV
jgi:hypothetical protein